MGHISNSESFRLNISSTWRQRSYAPRSQYFYSYTTALNLFECAKGSLKMLFNDLGIIISYGVVRDFAERFKVALHTYNATLEEYIIIKRNHYNRTALYNIWDTENRKAFKMSRPGAFGRWRNSNKWTPSKIDNSNERWGKTALPKKFQPKRLAIYQNKMQSFMQFNKYNYALTLLNKKKIAESNQVVTIKPTTIVKDSKFKRKFKNKKKSLHLRENIKNIIKSKNKPVRISHAFEQFGKRFSVYRTNYRIIKNLTQIRLSKKIKWYLGRLYIRQLNTLGVFRRNFKSLLNNIEVDMSRLVKKKVEISIKYIASRNVDSATMSRFVRVRLEQFDTFNEIVFPMVRHMRKITSWTGFMIRVAGRINRQQRASFNEYKEGITAFGTYAYPLDFTYDIAVLKYGVASIRIWISRGFKRQEGAMNKSYFKFQII